MYTNKIDEPPGVLHPPVRLHEAGRYRVPGRPVGVRQLDVRGDVAGAGYARGTDYKGGNVSWFALSRDFHGSDRVMVTRPGPADPWGLN